MKHVRLMFWFVVLSAFTVLAISLGACSPDEKIVANQSQALVCDAADSDTCCEPTSDTCGAKYGTPVNDYLQFPAHSNGQCTGAVSGAHQCAKYAKEFFTDALNHVHCSDGTEECKGFTQAWSVKRGTTWYNVALDAEANHPDAADPIFVLQVKNSGWNSTAETPREGDILVFENGTTGHFVVAKKPKLDNGSHKVSLCDTCCNHSDHAEPSADHTHSKGVRQFHAA
jgi:hypothetical protein